MYTKEEIKKVIKSQRVLRNVLTVEISLPLKKYARDENKVLTTQQVMEVFSEEHEILEVIKNDQLRNWPKRGYSQTGIWKFKIKKTKKTTATKSAPTRQEQEQTIKTEEQPSKIEEKKAETKTPIEPKTQKSTKKPSNSTSFRGRIKKIATKK